MSIKEKFKSKNKINVKEIINYKNDKTKKDTIQQKAFKALIAFLFIMIMCTMLSRFADSLTIPIVKTDKPKAKTMVEEVKALGRVVKNREDKVGILEGLKVEYVNVNIGSVIKKGDTLIELNLEELKKKIEEINEKISMENKTLDRAIEDYNKAINAKKEVAIKALDDMKIAKEALDDYRASDNKDEMTEKALEAEYKMKSEAYDVALNELNDNSALDRVLQDVKDGLNIQEYNEQKAKLQPYLDAEGKVISEVEGVVTNVFVENGGVTTDAIISIANKDTGYKFVGQIDKSKRNLIKQGQEVSVKVNGVEGIIEKLKIESISKSADNPEMIDVLVILPPGVGEIDDMGDIIISSKSKKYGTCVPVNAIRQGDSGYYILIVSETETVLGTEKIAKKVDVQIEKKDGEFAALNDGIIPRDADVIISSNKNIEDGDRVRLETE